MASDELGPLIKALNDLEQSAGFGQKYGPYFFAVALLVLVPFVCRAVFAGPMTAADPQVRKRAWEDFRFYFRSAISVGIVCVLAGVGWWLYENYRENARTLQTVAELKAKLDKIDAVTKSMNFTAYGVISSGLKPEDIFYATLIGPQMSIFFAKLPANLVHSEASWFFVVLSTEQLPSALDINVGWSQHHGGSSDATPIVNMPVHLMLAKKYGLYKFSLDKDPASIQPISN